MQTWTSETLPSHHTHHPLNSSGVIISPSLTAGSPKNDLVGGWTNPFETYERQIGSFPQGIGVKNLDLYSGKKASPLQTEAIQPACCKDEAVEDTSKCPRRIFLTGYYPASTRNKNIERSNVRMCINIHRRVSIKLVMCERRFLSHLAGKKEKKHEL